MVTTIILNMKASKTNSNQFQNIQTLNMLAHRSIVTAHILNVWAPRSIATY